MIPEYQINGLKGGLFCFVQVPVDGILMYKFGSRGLVRRTVPRLCSF